MKRFVCGVVILTLATAPLPSGSGSASKEENPWASQKRRLEYRIHPFADLYFYVYRFSSSSDKVPEVVGLAQSVEAAKQLPLVQTLVDQLPFELENSAAAAKAFAQFPENYKTKRGEDVALRAKAAPLANALTAFEEPFMKQVWPQHKVLIENVVKNVEKTLGPKEEELFDYFTRHLGMEKAESTVRVYFVAETPWPGGFTMWGKDETKGVCVISVTALKGPQLFTGILHEAIHAFDLETKGKGNVLVELRERLLQAGFKEDDVVVRQAPHLLVFIQSSEVVKRYLDPSFQPYSEGIFTRPVLQWMVNIEVPNWTAYLDGKISRDEALNRIVAGFVQARDKETAPKSTP